MHALPESTLRMLDIEARQDEALRQLEELERHVALALAESLPLARRLATHPGTASIGLHEPHVASELH
jgi:hypothetical protein